MILTSLRLHCEQGVGRAEATVEWESAERPPLELFVEVEERFAPNLASDPNAWLIAALLPAWRSREPRLRIDGSLCPVLCQRVKAALACLGNWYRTDFGDPPHIEAQQLEVRPTSLGRSVALLSCGIDSLATLRWNMLHVPKCHPLAIDSVIYFALDDYPEASRERLLTLAGPRRSAVEAVALAAGVTPVAVRSNLWWLADDGTFYTDKWHGAVCAALLSFFAPAFRGGYIAASCFDPSLLLPWGSHPLLDPCYSSAHFQIQHDLWSMNRLEKTALVASWADGAVNIRVCQNDSLGGPNCGTCEKCIRTMLSLAALGKLEQGRPSFPEATLTRELVLTMAAYKMISGLASVTFYRKLVPLLRERGLFDVADALETVLADASATSLGEH